jgi:hypothetical protein
MNTEELYWKVKGGPTFLLLGQDYLRLESGIDPFLSEVLRKYGDAEMEPVSYNQIFECRAKDLNEIALAWMQERCERLSPPQWLKTVASFSWNGVYTSAIDTIWMRAFRLEWRELQPLVDEKYKPSDPRNRSKLLCTFLFGNVNRTGESERPPLSRREWAKRNRVANNLLQRLPEIITPLGILLIDGYAGKRDWLSLNDLALTIDDLNTEQVHLFNAVGDLKEELTSHEDIADLIGGNKLVLHEESLSSFLLSGAGMLRLGEQLETETYGYRIDWGERPKIVPIHLWNQVSRSAIILDDSVLQGTNYSSDKTYDEFRNFLNLSATKPVWSGYYHSFAFSRDFETRLLTKVREALEGGTGEFRHIPIILHGQTGTGKTVALGALAFKIRKERKYPVLFIERKPQKPNMYDIDAFCKWAEDNNATTCLIVWDGMVEIEQYYSLVRELESRGRSVVVVGSCYKLEVQQSQGLVLANAKNLVFADASLNKDEFERLNIFLSNIDPILGQVIKRKIRMRNGLPDQTFLVALYRLLEPTRPQLRIGVVREASLTEQKIEKLIQAKQLKESFDNTLAIALLKEGKIPLKHAVISEFEDGDEEDGAEEENNAREKTDESKRLIGLVMVPGSFGHMLPIELLIRALGLRNTAAFTTILNQFDIFVWGEDESGNITIGPRNAAEATFVVQAWFREGDEEVEYIQDLLLEVKADVSYENSEIEFAVELVKSLKPEHLTREFGSDPQRFTSHFRNIAESLGKLREERGVYHPRLILQEANYLREAVIKQSRGGSPYQDTIELLDKAITIINLALKMLETNRDRNKKLRVMLLAELAAILGAKLEHSLTLDPELFNGSELYRAVREQVFKARALDPENYYPIDVFAWVTQKWIESEKLSNEDRANAEADILHVFEMANAGEFSVVQRQRFLVKQIRIAEVLNNYEMSEEAFNALLAEGSSAGYYIKARNMLGPYKNNIYSLPLSDEQIDCYWNAIDYLEEHRENISRDPRCLYLLLRLWWIVQTGVPMFYLERQILPFDEKLWDYCYGLLKDLMDAEDFYITPQIKFLYGLATFHLGDVEQAFEIFEQLKREAGEETGYRRLTRSYLASEPGDESGGRAQVFTGEEVTWVNAKGTRGRVFLEELHREVFFVPHEFGDPSIQKFASLGKFHLAFNFIGPIADPIPARK